MNAIELAHEPREKSRPLVGAGHGFVEAAAVGPRRLVGRMLEDKLRPGLQRRAVSAGILQNEDSSTKQAQLPLDVARFLGLLRCAQVEEITAVDVATLGERCVEQAKSGALGAVVARCALEQIVDCVDVVARGTGAGDPQRSR